MNPVATRVAAAIEYGAFGITGESGPDGQQILGGLVGIDEGTAMLSMTLD